MKKFFAGVLVGAIIASAIAFAAATFPAATADFKVFVNGEEFISDPPTVVIENRTFLPLRAIGDALGVKVEWNEELRQVEVGEPPAVPSPDVTPEGEEITITRNFMAAIPEEMDNPAVVITANYPDGSKQVVFTGVVARNKVEAATAIPVTLKGKKEVTVSLSATYNGQAGNANYAVIE